MLFNSIEYFIFLPLVFVTYWAISRRKIYYQNSLLLVASYLFYGWWDWRLLSLIMISTITDYWIAQKIYSNSRESKRKYYLWGSLFINLGLLATFKYFNFFVDSWNELWLAIGYTHSIKALNIILPVGISFYTFQTLSYSIDVYRI